MNGLVLSNVNMDPLKSYYKNGSIEFGDFNDLFLQLANPASHAASGNHDFIFCHLDGELFCRRNPDDKEFLKLLSEFLENNPQKTIILSLLCADPIRSDTFSWVHREEAPQSRLQKTNSQLIHLANQYDQLVLLDFPQIVSFLGFEQTFSSKFFYLGRIRYTQKLFQLLACRLNEALMAYNNQVQKLLVLDLDNTLWSGVIGEDGPMGVALSEDGVGKIFRDFQRNILELKNLGVLLAICSKNNLKDVEDIFEKNSMMVLSSNDFVSIVANWSPKSQNLELLSKELSLGLDSFVFIDDNPVEREQIRQALPQVIVPEFPENKEDIPTWFIQEVVYPYFPKYRLSQEDAHRTLQYKTNKKRIALKNTLGFEEFIKGLEIRTSLYIDDKDHINRASQLTQKTNQFNTTTKRYSPSDIQEFMLNPDFQVTLMEYEDKFGKEGIVGLSIFNIKKGEIDSLLLSCRVIGRQVEQVLLENIIQTAKKHKLKVITAKFIPTKKNAPAKDFYPASSFKLTLENSDGMTYEKEIS